MTSWPVGHRTPARDPGWPLGSCTRAPRLPCCINQLTCSIASAGESGGWIMFLKWRGFFFSVIMITPTRHCSQVPYLQICLLANIYSNPQINTSHVGPTCAQAATNWSRSLHPCSAELKQGDALLSGFSPQAGNKHALRGLFSAHHLQFCAFVVDFAV